MNNRRKVLIKVLIKSTVLVTGNTSSRKEMFQSLCIKRGFKKIFSTDLPYKSGYKVEYKLQMWYVILKIIYEGNIYSL